jgi:uncharacterized protein with ATP-grasp and redox domains
LKLYRECYQCLSNLVVQAVEMATENEQLREKARKEGLKILDEDFSYDAVSIVVATRIHNIIKGITQNPDPYRFMKNTEIETARELFLKLRGSFGDSFKDLLQLAVLGNTLDFFRPIKEMKDNMNNVRHVEFIIDDSGRFEILLKRAHKVLYLADNAGEVFFDIPLLKWMRQYVAVLYVVKSLPVQNDLTLEEIRSIGLEDEVVPVITTGTATPGVDFSQASEQFIQEYNTADLVFAKGMGYYESLSEFPATGKVLHCLVAKCGPVADSLKVPLNSYVAMLR